MSPYFETLGQLHDSPDTNPPPKSSAQERGCFAAGFLEALLTPVAPITTGNSTNETTPGCRTTSDDGAPDTGPPDHLIESPPKPAVYI